MNEVVVTFVGICTHVTGVPMTPPPDAVGSDPLPYGRYHRVVLVNGRLGLRLKGKGMPPHDPLLIIPKMFVEGTPPEIGGLELVPNETAWMWKMEGVSMYVADAVPGMIIDDDFDALIPSLTERADVLSLQLDSRVVVDGRAAGMFDVFGGTLSAFPYEKAVFADLTIKTVPEKPTLWVTQNWDQTKKAIPLVDATIDGEQVPPHVLVMNTGREADDPFDFMMHYEITTSTPDIDPPRDGEFTPDPPRPDGRRRRFLEFVPEGLTVGCSNSVYP